MMGHLHACVRGQVLAYTLDSLVFHNTFSSVCAPGREGRMSGYHENLEFGIPLVKEVHKLVMMIALFQNHS